MAKKRTVFVDVVVDDKGTTKKLAIDSKRLSDGLQRGAKGTKDFDRNLRGVIQTSQAGGRNFAAIAQGITGGIVPAYAAFAAQVFAIGAAFRFLREAGDLKTLEAGQIAYASATGKALNTLTKSIQAATDNQIAFQDAAQAAAIGTAAGLTSSQLERLGGAAKDVSIVLGRDVTDSFNRLVRGVTKAEPELLDELGIVLRLKDATEEYARALGKNASDLSTYERSQAVANNVLTQAEEKYGRIIDIVDPSINKFNAFGKAFDDIVNSIKRGLDTLLAPIAGFLAKNPFATLLLSAPLLNGIIKTMVPGFNGLGNAASDALGGIADGLAETKRNANVKLTSLKFLAGDAEAASEFVKITNAELVDLADVSETSFRGLKTLQDGGKLAGKTIQTNLKQARLALGPFENLPDTVRLEYVRMFEDLSIAGSLSSNKVANSFQIGFAKMRASFTAVKLRIISGFQTIAKAAQKAANKIAGAFTKVLSGIGIATLVFDGIKTMARAAGFNVDALTPALADYSEKVGSINAETHRFVDLQRELNKEFAKEKKFSLNVAQNIAELSKNIDAITEGQGITDLINFLNAEDTYAMKLDKVFGGIFGGEIEDLVDNQIKRVKDLRESFQITGMDQSSKAAKAYTRELQKLEDVLNRYKASGFTGDFLNTEFDVKALIDAKIAYEGLGTTIASLKEAQKEADSAVQDAFKNLIPDTTYDNLIRQLELVKKANDAILEDQTENAVRQAGLDMERVQRTERLLSIFTKEQNRLNELKDTEQKRAIFITKVSRGQTKGTRQRIAAITKILEIEDQTTDLLAKQQTIVDTIGERDGVILAEEEAILRNIQLQIIAREQQKAALEDSLDSIKRINQAVSDGFEQSLEKNIFEALTGKEDDFKQFLLKIAQGTYEALAQELSKILTQNILTGLNISDKDQELKDLYNGKNGIFTVGANTIGSRINTEIDKLKKTVADMASKNAALRKAQKLPEESNSTDAAGGLFGKVDLRSKPVEIEKKSAIINTQSVNIQQLESAIIGGKKITGSDNIIEALEGSGYNFGPEDDVPVKRTPFGNIVPNKTGTDKTTEKNEDAATQQTEASALQKANAATYSSAVNQFSAAIASGGLAGGAGGVGVSLATTFISSFANAAAGNFARYGGIMKDYSTGGIARGRDAGYPAMLHGTEAVVPLPNGKSIPVDISGSGGGVNNVSVSVNMDGSTNVQGGEEGGQDLGKVIAGAVQQELQRQKRPGGILSPLGAA